jgi:hypothetical protein
MQHIATSVDIAAPVRRVWSILMDFDAYPGWNPFIRGIVGQPNPGTTLLVTIQPVGGRAMTMSPTVLSRVPEREFRWKGKLVLPGIFDGEHCFRLSAVTDVSTRLVHEEFFTGWLVPVAMRGRLKAGTVAGFEAMNQALKARAERSLERLLALPSS